MRLGASPRVRAALSWLPAASYVGLIWWLSSQQVKLPDVPGSDKSVHFVEYGVLGACFLLAVTTTFPRRGVRAAFAAVWLTAGAGLLDELHQAFVSGRSADLLDFVADVTGGAVFVLGLWLSLVVLRRRADAEALV